MPEGDLVCVALAFVDVGLFISVRLNMFWKIRPNIQRDAFLDPEGPPETHGFPGPALLPVIVVICGPGAKCPGSGWL